MRQASALLLLPFLITSLAAAENERTRFRWIDPAGETAGVGLATRRAESLEAAVVTGPPVEIEVRRQVSGATTRVTRRVYGKDVNGRRRALETVVEEIRELEGGGYDATRTVSRADLGGGMRAVERQTQRAVPEGEGFEVTFRSLAPGPSGALEERERVRQSERRDGEAVEIDRLRYQPDLSGKWSVVERRVSQSTESEGETRTGEQLYRYDVNNRLRLERQVEAREWKVDGGESRMEAEIFNADLDGKLRFAGRVQQSRRELGEGREEITETREEGNPAAPGEGVRVVRKLVERSAPAGAEGTRRVLEVQEPSPNGGMRVTHTQETVETR
ncbi:MAG: hypothetical protein JXP48_04650 [Acidobacteria bacterium]|nr:hypothetical protein [Acidobacteriota bacterium]